MSVIPEILFVQKIKSEIVALRKEPNRLRMLFGNYGQTTVDYVVSMLSNPIYIHMHCLPQEIALPSILISLRGESEMQATLGSDLGVTTGVSDTIGNMPASSFGYDSTEVIGDEEELRDEFYTENPRLINTSQYDFQEMQGTIYKASYYFDIFANKAQVVTALYTILKYVLSYNRLYFDENGIKEIVISGSDLVGTDQAPIPFIRRSMIVNFIYVFSYFEELETAKGFDVTANAFDMTTDDYTGDASITGPELPTVLTSITPGSGVRNTTGNISIIEGDNIQGYSIASFPDNDGITVTETSLIVSTVTNNVAALKVTYDIGEHASVGTTTVKVTNIGGLYAELTNGFTVT